ncbi:MAG: NADH-quinone oxidoreductase subunit NuoN [Lysobacterales bacterium]
MNSSQLLLAAPEIWVLIMACVIMVVDLFLPEARRGIIHGLAMLTVIFAAIITLRGDFLTGGAAAVTAFNGSFIRDAMGDVLKVFAYLLMALIYIYSKFYLRNFKMFRADFYTLSLEALLGVMLLISANSMLMIYLGLELISLSVYALVAFNRDSSRGSESAMKYFVLGSMASGILLYGMSMIYGATGSLALADVSAAIAAAGSGDVLLIFGLVFVVVGIAFKFGAVPFHMWIPDVYEGAPPAVILFISSVPKLAAFAMAYRFLSSALGDLHVHWQSMLAVLAALSIILGNLAAIMQKNIKRMLAYSTISHMGFVLLGLVPGAAYGFGASMYYVIVYGLMSVAAFAMVILLSAKGEEAEQIEDFKGLNQRHPFYAAIMGLVLFSMAGVPPMVGFFAKLLVLKAVVEAGMLWLAAGAVVFAVIGAFYYLRVIWYMYFSEAESEDPIIAPVDFGAALTLNGLMILGLGLFSGSLISICMMSFGI